MSTENESPANSDDAILTAAARHASNAVRAFIVHSDIEPASPKDPFCELFRLMSAQGWPLQEALLRARTLLLIERGTVPPTTQHAERASSLDDHLVQWAIACYYNVEIPTGAPRIPSPRYG